MDPIKHTLATVLKGSDGDVTELVFNRRIQAKDFKGMPAELDQDANMLLISRLTNVELSTIEQMDGHDYLKVGEILQLFLGFGPTIGKKS